MAHPYLMFFDVATIANNVSSIATTYTLDQINGAIQERVVFGFLKLLFGTLIAIGLSKTDVKELKALAVGIIGLFSVLGAIDFMRAIIGAMTQSMP